MTPFVAVLISLLKYRWRFGKCTHGYFKFTCNYKIFNNFVFVCRAPSSVGPFLLGGATW